MTTQTCQQCIDECKAQGGLCEDLDFAAREAASEAGIVNVDVEQQKHRWTAHLMTLDGAMWRCVHGHSEEADPVVAMRANGVKELL